MVEIMKALADENRLRILNVLFKRELCVCELEVMIDTTQSNVSRHLAKLKQAGIIEQHKEGLWVFYRLNPSFVAQYPSLYESLSKKLPDESYTQEDLGRLSRYESQALTCECIRQDKEAIRTQLSLYEVDGLIGIKYEENEEKCDESSES